MTWRSAAAAGRVSPSASTGGNDTVQGCYIGVGPDSKTPSHAAAAGNLNYGVEITNSSSDTLNGDVISANQQGGVYITSGAAVKPRCRLSDRRRSHGRSSNGKPRVPRQH